MVDSQRISLGLGSLFRICAAYRCSSGDVQTKGCTRLPSCKILFLFLFCLVSFSYLKPAKQKQQSYLAIHPPNIPAAGRLHHVHSLLIGPPESGSPGRRRRTDKWGGPLNVLFLLLFIIFSQSYSFGALSSPLGFYFQRHPVTNLDSPLSEARIKKKRNKKRSILREPTH